MNVLYRELRIKKRIVSRPKRPLLLTPQLSKYTRNGTKSILRIHEINLQVKPLKFDLIEAHLALFNISYGVCGFVIFAKFLMTHEIQ